MKIQGPHPLTRAIRRDEFDSGNPALDDWFLRYALQAHLSGSTKVFVAHQNDRALGFYALSAGSVERDDAPARVSRGLGALPVPVALLARLGVDRTAQRRGLGQALLKDALLRVDQASEHLGVRAVMAHAKNEPAKAFYRVFGFETSPINPLWMFLLLKDLRRSVRPR